MGLLFWNQGIKFLLGVVALGCLMFYPEVSFAAENGENIVQQSTNNEIFLAKVKENGKWGYIDQTGRTIIPIVFNDVGDFSSGIAKVKLNGKYGYYNRTGKEIIPAIYDELGDIEGE